MPKADDRAVETHIAGEPGARTKYMHVTRDNIYTVAAAVDQASGPGAAGVTNDEDGTLGIVVNEFDFVPVGEWVLLEETEPFGREQRPDVRHEPQWAFGGSMNETEFRELFGE